MKKNIVVIKRFYIDIALFLFTILLILVFIDAISIKLIMIGVLWLIGILKILNEMRFSKELQMYQEKGFVSNHLQLPEFIQENPDQFQDKDFEKVICETDSINLGNIRNNHKDINEIIENEYIDGSKQEDLKSNINKKKIVFDQQNKKINKSYVDNNKELVQSIKGLVLISEAGVPIDQWEIFGKISLIIGKENNRFDVDIDLSGSAYAAFIDYQHAVLNYYNAAWHIEDYYSDNGVFIEKKGFGIYQVSPKEPCKIDVGDIIYIANTKLLVI